ncbi:DMT family transporter [Gimibacter soli]|uniref:DMT family transporter n=1 Tax=Gimibacter soli TaxID=3024400 RepID=A0AAE9XPP0_9PROT|nr:DMT family transporter [Gimibacter soli]WCL53962.1 DMT family transporter [Gimibacter soli]
MSAHHPVMSAREWGLLLALSLVWGGSFFFVEIALRDLPPFSIVAGRVTCGALAILVMLRMMGKRLPTGLGVWRDFLAMGFMNNFLPFSLLVWGQTQIGSGLASILNATTPIFAVVVAHLFTADEKMTGNRLIGVVVGFAGVVLMIGPDALNGIGGNVWGQLACVGAAISYSFAGIYGRRFKKAGIDPMVAAAGQIIGSGMLIIPMMLIVDQPWTLPMPHMATFGAILFIGIFSTALAYTVYFRLLASAGATNVMLVTFLVPVSAILLGTIFLGEKLAGDAFLGLACLGVGLAAIDGRAFSYFRRKGWSG